VSAKLFKVTYDYILELLLTIFHQTDRCGLHTQPEQILCCMNMCQWIRPLCAPLGHYHTMEN